MTQARYLLSDERLFHAYSRGTGPIPIYRDEGDYATFSTMLHRAIEKFEWDVYAYCLMPTHYHLLVATPVEQLSAGMHRLNGGYAKTFNRRHGRVGHLFGTRFHSRAVDDDEYLSRTASYIVQNPVRAGHCTRPSEWPWTWWRYGPLDET